MLLLVHRDARLDLRTEVHWEKFERNADMDGSCQHRPKEISVNA